MVKYVKVKSGELNKDSELKTQEGNKSTVPTKLSTMWSHLKHISGDVLRRPVLVVSLAVTGLLLGGRQLNLFEPSELVAYDVLMQSRPALPPDPRLLIVRVTEADIQSYPPYPLTDALMNQLLQKLERYQPSVIGLDIYRDQPVQPGHDELSARLRTSDRIIPMCEKKKAENRDVPPPPGVPEERVGFNDIPIDPSGIVRRALLFITIPPTANTRCTTQFSLAFVLAQQYLKKQQGIEPELIKQDQQEYLKLGKFVFKPLSPYSGGYQRADTGGYQILLNYRSSDALAHSVTLSDVLNNRLDPNWVKDRIVLIGITAASVGDTFYTPYSQAQKIQKMPGVVVHGQIVSQLLSTVLDGRPVFWFWSEWAEVLWIFGWSVTGGLLVRVIRHPGRQVLAEATALGLLSGISVVLFFNAGWIPVVAPVLGLIASGTGVLAYNAYEDQLKRLQAEKERLQAEEQRLKAEQERLQADQKRLKTEEELLQAKAELLKIEEKAKEQDQNIALLQALLKEKTYTPSPTEPDESLDEELGETAIPSAEEWEWSSEDEEDEEDDEEDPTVIVDSKDTPTSVRPAKTARTGDTNLLAGHYKISRVLGQGGFGMTYLAQDIHRPGSPQCVVKRLKPARSDEKFLKIARRLFDTEAEILEKLGDHPQIPRLLAHFVEKQEFYLVQEFVDGHALSDELPVDKRLPEAQVIEIIEGVLEILAFIHAHSVIHRDIKPSNIMRRVVDHKFVLIDFGAVKQIRPQELASQEGFTVAIGTRGYAPPEQYAGHPSFSSDIYALGMIGIQAVTGIATHQLPVSTETGDISWRHLANVSEEFAGILEKMVRYHFADRYQSAAEVMKAFDGLKVCKLEA